MEENATGMEQTTETTDAFMEGWSDEPETVETTADQPEEAGTEDTQDQQQADTAGGEGQEPAGEQQSEAADGAAAAQEADGDKAQQQPPAAEATPKTWQLRHLDETRTVSEQELVALAQKGLDYDRIHDKYEEFRPVMDLFSQFANKAGMNTRDYVAHIRQEAKKAEGMNAEDAKRAVELEDREATVAAKEAAEAERQRERQDAEAQKQSAEQRRMADIQEFQKTFPDAAKDPKGIPKEVWDGVRSGLSLVASYARWQVAQAKEQAAKAEHNAAAAQQNQKNANRSTGSMKSAGEDNRNKDPFLDGWDS